MSDSDMGVTQDRGNLPPPGAGSQPRDLTGRLLGDFQIERLLGRGGMGEVYLARQLSLDRPVALKVLKPELLSNPVSLARFEKEALGAAKLNHPNIVHVYSFGTVQNIKFIAMEYVAGINLKEYLARKGTPELPLALSIIRQSGQAVAAAGEVGLVHRDLKPENLLMTRKGLVKVADFGLCRESTASGQLALTQEGVTLGTPLYMSPEQVQGKEVDHRSDLYSLGVTYYHMFAGKPPFQGESPLAVAVAHVQTAPVHLSVHRPDLPPELCALVMKLMAKEPAARFASASEMCKELARVREAIGSQATLAEFLARPPSEELPTNLGPARATAPRTPRAKAPVAPASGGPLRIRKLHVAAVVAVAMILGALTGGRGRAENLLSNSAPRPSGQPALWLGNWESVPKAASAEAQYRLAQLHTPGPEREAAWLAVAGHFPDQVDWSSRAYVQLARLWFRQGDSERLEALARALEAGPEAAAPSLPSVARAAAKVIKHDVEGLLRLYVEDIPIDERQDPAINELSLELLAQARRQAEGSSTQGGRLKALEEKLWTALQLHPLMRLDWINLEGGLVDARRGPRA